MNDQKLYALQYLVNGKWEFIWKFYGLDTTLNIIGSNFTGSKERAEAELELAVTKRCMDPARFRICEWEKVK